MVVYTPPPSSILAYSHVGLYPPLCWPLPPPCWPLLPPLFGLSPHVVYSHTPHMLGSANRNILPCHGHKTYCHVMAINAFCLLANLMVGSAVNNAFRRSQALSLAPDSCPKEDRRVFLGQGFII